VDDATRRVVLEATGKDSRGNGTASATVTATLSPSEAPGPAHGDGHSTTVGVITDLTITGRPAQLGRGLIGEVGGKILNAFADCLATRLADARESHDAPAAPQESSVAKPASAAGTATGTVAGETATSSTVVGDAAPGEDAPESAAVPPAGTAPSTIPQPRRPTAPMPRPVAAADEIDLLEFAGQPMLKRLIPVAAGVLALLLVLRWLRRRG
jgi:uncharacterized protein